MNSPKQTKLSEHIIKSIVQPVHEPRSFTTEPKSGRRKPNKTSISLERAKLFMEHLYSKGLRECSYETLEFEFIQCFGTNEPKVLVKYLGKPARTVYYSGSSVVRVNKVNGKVAHFEYQNLRRVSAKKGLLEVLGFVSKKGERYVLHHELFPYSKRQASIDNFSLLQPTGEVKSEGLEAVEKEKEEEVIEGGERKNLWKKS